MFKAGCKVIFELNYPSVRENYDFSKTTLTINNEEFEAANRRAAERQAAGPMAGEALYHGRLEKVVVQLSSSLGIMFSPQEG